VTSIRLAPTRGHVGRRVTAILLAGAVVGIALRLALGPPSRLRSPKAGPRPPYGPTLPFGAIQLASQAALMAAGVSAARRLGGIRL
jgi:hypothetical protein